MTPESRLTKKILLSLFKEFGGFWTKIAGGRFQTTGLPDIIGCVNGKFVGIEVKTPKRVGKVTERQQLILQKISESGGLGFVCASSDEAIARVRSFLQK